ncbi:hypothetical protein VTO73DRAFT_2188 [Trametes versicolor]
MAHSNYSQSAVEQIKRHPKYYLNGGDVHFLVENYIYRVHRYFFERESAWFREKLGAPAPAGQTPKGSSDANPFPLEEVAADDFSKFLWVFYNPKYSIYDAVLEDWVAILKLAFDWRFSEVKKLCSRELEKYEIAPVPKIELYQTYELDKKLLIPSYMAICLRAEPLSLKEGRHLGLETALLLATARECARGKPLANGARSPTAAELEEEDMVSIIKEIFGLTPGPPSPSLTPLDKARRGANSKPVPVPPESPTKPSAAARTTNTTSTAESVPTIAKPAAPHPSLTASASAARSKSPPPTPSPFSGFGSGFGTNAPASTTTTPNPAAGKPTTTTTSSTTTPATGDLLGSTANTGPATPGKDAKDGGKEPPTVAKPAGDAKEPATPIGDKGPVNTLKGADAAAGGDDGTDTGDEKAAKEARSSNTPVVVPEAGEAEGSGVPLDATNTVYDPTDSTEPTNTIGGAGTDVVVTTNSGPNAVGESAEAALTSNLAAGGEEEQATEPGAGGAGEQQDKHDVQPGSSSEPAIASQPQDTTPANSQEAASEDLNAGDPTSGTSQKGVADPSPTAPSDLAGEGAATDVTSTEPGAQADAAKVNAAGEAARASDPASGMEGAAVKDGAAVENKGTPTPVADASPSKELSNGDGTTNTDKALPLPPGEAESAGAAGESETAAGTPPPKQGSLIDF